MSKLLPVLTTISGSFFVVCTVAFFDCFWKHTNYPDYVWVYGLAALTNGMWFMYGMLQYLDEPYNKIKNLYDNRKA